jgi:hypothetical protein
MMVYILICGDNFFSKIILACLSTEKNIEILLVMFTITRN